MIRSQLKIAVFILLTVLATSNLNAQTTINYTAYLLKDDNAFKNKEAYEEWINNSILLVGHRYSAETYQLQGYYSLNLLQYANNSDLSNYAHKIGFAGSFQDVFEDDDYTVDIRGYVRLNKYQENYNYYNVNGYNVSASIQYTPSLEKIYSCGLVAAKDHYEEITDLNNNSYRIWGKYQRFFQSKISITGETSLGTKNYFNQTVMEYFGQSMGGARYTEEPVQAVLLSLSGTIGKSITQSIGVNLGVGGQRFIGDPITSYSEGIYYYTENDIYDDPYSYQNRYVSFQLTKQFAIGFQGKFGSKYQVKDYAGTPAIDENGELTGDTREDSRNEYFLMITKKFETRWKFPTSIDVFVNYMYRSNPSNDPYYNFKDNVGLIGFSIGR